MENNEKIILLLMIIFFRESLNVTNGKIFLVYYSSSHCVISINTKKFLINSLYCLFSFFFGIWKFIWQNRTMLYTRNSPLCFVTNANKNGVRPHFFSASTRLTWGFSIPSHLRILVILPRNKKSYCFSIYSTKKHRNLCNPEKRGYKIVLRYIFRSFVENFLNSRDFPWRNAHLELSLAQCRIETSWRNIKLLLNSSSPNRKFRANLCGNFEAFRSFHFRNQWQI